MGREVVPSVRKQAWWLAAAVATVPRIAGRASERAAREERGQVADDEYSRWAGPRGRRAAARCVSSASWGGGRREGRSGGRETHRAEDAELGPRARRLGRR